jgi:putative FmdB family regulatory protein
MPTYDYYCHTCKRRVAIYSSRFLSSEEMDATCPRCQGKDLRRMIGRVGVLRSEDSRAEEMSDLGAMSGLDENDPRSLGRFMRKMSAESGEELGPEFDEVVGRLESGEKPEDIEKSMPEMGGADADAGAGAGDFGGGEDALGL